MSLPTHAPAHFRGEVRTTAVLDAPLVAGHFPTGMLGFVDAALAGHHGTTTLASVSVGTALFWLALRVPMGTLTALPPSVSQRLEVHTSAIQSLMRTSKSALC